MNYLKLFEEFEEFEELSSEESAGISIIEDYLPSLKDLSISYVLGSKEAFLKKRGSRGDYEVGYSEFHRNTGIPKNFTDYIFLTIKNDELKPHINNLIPEFASLFSNLQQEGWEWIMQLDLTCTKEWQSDVMISKQNFKRKETTTFPKIETVQLDELEKYYTGSVIVDGDKSYEVGYHERLIKRIREGGYLTIHFYMPLKPL